MRTLLPVLTLLAALAPPAWPLKEAGPPTPVVAAPWGAVRGVTLTREGGHVVKAYLGIRYALPPVGNLRLEKPQPHPGVAEGEVHVADTHLPACMQVVGLITAEREMSEDCLMLSVYTPPEAAADAKLPVMFWIHGGGFNYGDAQFYSPAKMVNQGQVIVVTVQYRLGAFGFFASSDGRVPGNQGMWDQLLALQWVKNNIRAFGGDPDLITVFGESAGSMSTGILLLSAQTKGLFKRAILQSGSPQSITIMSEMFKSMDVFGMLAEGLGCSVGDTDTHLACVQKASAEEFFNVSSQINAKSPIGGFFFPLIDGEFIPRDPLELLGDEEYVRGAEIDKRDVLMGVNNMEGSLLIMFVQMMGQGDMETLNTPAFFRQTMLQCFLVQGISNPDDRLKKIVEFFYLESDLGTNETVDRQHVADMFGDCIMMASILQWTEALVRLDIPQAARYLYILEHPFSVNNAGPYPGSHHGDELFFEFDRLPEFDTHPMLLALNKTKLTAEEEPLGDMYIKILTDFAKTGNPSPAVAGTLGGEWPTFDAETQAYLSLSLKPELGHHGGKYRTRAALWNTLLPQLKDVMGQEAEKKGEEKADEKAARDEL